jgi:hypothetical protein
VEFISSEDCVRALDKIVFVCSDEIQNTVQSWEGASMLQLAKPTPSELAIKVDPKAMIVDRVRGEFREMPGLTLTLAQACRLWSLDAASCTEVLGQLVESGFLSRKADGLFCRASDLAARPFRMAKAGVELVDLDSRRGIAHA